MGFRNRIVLALVFVIILLSACSRGKPPVSTDGEDTIKNETFGVVSNTENGETITEANKTKALWKNISPVKMVNGKPLYINFIEDVPRYKSWNTKVIEAGNDRNGSRILVYSASTLTDLELFKVCPDMDGDIEYYKGEVLLSLDELTPDTVIILTTFLPDVIDANGIAFTDNEGNRHMYIFGDNGENTKFHLTEEPQIIIDGENH